MLGHTRSINTLSIPPLQSFSLEPPAVLLPSSVSQLSVQPRPSFFEPPTQQVQQQVYPPLQQYVAPYVPPVGTGPNYSFVPFLERDEKIGVCMFQSMHVRPEFSTKSPEECRLEDYNSCGVASYVTPAVAMPGAVDMGFRPQSMPVLSAFNQLSQPAAAPSVFGFTATPQPAINFGTNTQLGLFQNASVQPSAFSAFAQPQVSQASAFSSFGVPQQQQIPQWGTATAGFGFGFNQPSSVFGTMNQVTPFSLAPLAFPSFGFNNFPLSQPSFQIPTQASFFWNASPIECFQQFLKTLPTSINSCSFGGVQVSLPSPAMCAALRADEKTLIAKPDADPFDLAHSLHTLPQPPVFTLEPPAIELLSSSVTTSPLRRGSSSPVVSSSSHSPLLLPQSGLCKKENSLVPPSSLGAPAITASFNNSPRLCALPTSPYVESRALAPPVTATRSVSHHTTPTKPTHVSHHSLSLHSMLHGVQSSPRLHSAHHHHSASSSAILFSSQSESQNSPNRLLSTPEQQHHSIGRRLDLGGVNAVH